ncbi:MAG: FkbM family methyltransferase [Sphingobacteriales bacterium]|nr:MAG: FkbM family methyltransferase [Sphingobacteriales bacterium]
MQKQLMQQIQQVEQLANGGKLGRLLHDPVRYLTAQTFLKYIYPKTQKGKLAIAKTFFGHDMEVLLPAATDIYLTGGKTHASEIRLAKFMISRLQPEHVYMDIGAHFGYYTLLAAKLVGENGKVFAFEAAGKTYEVLQRNVKGHKQVQALHNAVSNSEEVISFYEFPILYSEYNSMDVAQFKNEEWIKKYKPEQTEVRAVTIDIFAEALFKKPDFIKIDVEGAEDKVLLGCKETLAKYHPVVVMEYISNSVNMQVYDRAMLILLELGYIAHFIEGNGELRPVKNLKQEILNNTSENLVFIYRQKGEVV